MLAGVWDDGWNLQCTKFCFPSFSWWGGGSVLTFDLCSARKHLPLMTSIWHRLERFLAVGWRNRDYVSASLVLLDRWCQFIFLWGFNSVWDAKVESRILYVWHWLVANCGQENNWIIQNAGASQIAFNGFVLSLRGVFCICSKSLKPSFITELLIFIWPKGCLDI